MLQCSVPCHEKTYDNEELIRHMVAEQKDMKVPEEFLPRCPVCGKPMTVNLRCDGTFVQDEGWEAAYERYRAFFGKYKNRRIVLLELGVGGNTPAIIKYPFWRLAAQNPRATYICINAKEAVCPPEIKERSVLIGEDIAKVLAAL